MSGSFGCVWLFDCCRGCGGAGGRRGAKGGPPIRALISKRSERDALGFFLEGFHVRLSGRRMRLEGNHKAVRRGDSPGGGDVDGEAPVDDKSF